VRRHEQRVRRFLVRLSREDADDLAQEAFLKAWRMAPAWRGDGSYEGWLLRIAWRCFLSDRRRRRDSPDEAGEPAAAPDSPEIRLDLARALASLPERERAAASLCFGEGYSHGEAAAILEMPLGTLKGLVARARSRLAKMLEEQGR
jgi:RNA polymerase sigma factor (sigma-70 family)